jgi:hypothetical protein
MTRDQLKLLIRERDDLVLEISDLKKLGDDKDYLSGLTDLEKVDLDIRFRKLLRCVNEAERKYGEGLEKYLNNEAQEIEVTN